MNRILIYSIAAMLCAATSGAHAQALIDSTNETFSFTGWNGSLPEGFFTEGSSNAVTYRGESASTTGGLYSLSTTPGFTYQPSSTASPLSLTGTFENGLGGSIASLTISYDAYIAVIRESRTPGWTVTSSLGDVVSLDWNFTEGDSTETVILEGLNIAPGETFTITWASDRGAGSGSSPMIGLNEIEFTATAVPEPGTAALMVLGAAALFWRLRRRV